MGSKVMAIMVAFVAMLASCVVGPPPPSARDVLIKSEQINADDIQAYCYTKYATDELRCGQAQAEKQELEATRAEMVRQRELERAREEREWARWAARNERERARKEREFAREMEGYQRCQDRQAQSTVGLGSPIIICMPPTRP